MAASDEFDELIESVVHGAVEAYVQKMTEALTKLLVEGVENPDMLSTFAARAKQEAFSVFEHYRGRIAKETRQAFLKAIENYTDEVMQTLQGTNITPKLALTKQGKLELTQAARGVAEVIRRQNISLAHTASDTWFRVASKAIVRKELGDSYRSIMEDCISELSDAGIQTIDYKSGIKTTIDAAVRRHIVSQASQAKAHILDDACDKFDHDLVFVSSHFGARPTHAMWQGKVYSRSGTSKKYPSLDEGTGYSGTGPFGSLADRLCGVNCRHDMTPYMEGLSELPDTKFEEEQKRCGMTSDEFYKATQKQRAYEREVRKYKRRIATGQAQDLDMMADRQRLGHTQALLREHCRENNLTRNYERERAYGVAKQPRGLGRIDFKRARALRSQESESSIKHKRKAAPAELLKKTTVSPDLINSKKFAAKFKKINENKQTRKELLRHAKIMLTTNSGTLQEGMAFIDTRNGETFWSVTSSGTDLHVEAPLEAIKEIRARNEQAGKKVVVALHTHPRGYPPSSEDFVACARKEYKAGYVAGSNGSVYEYTANDDFITQGLISDAAKKEEVRSKSDVDAIIKAIERLSKDYDISCRKL